MIAAPLLLCTGCLPVATSDAADIAVSAHPPITVAAAHLAQEGGPAGEPGTRGEPRGAGSASEVGPRGPDRGDAAPEAERGPVAEQSVREQAAPSSADMNRERADAHLAEHQPPGSSVSFGLNTTLGGIGLSDNQGNLGGSFNIFGVNELTDMLRNPTDFAKGFTHFGATPQLTYNDKGEIGFGVSLGGLVASVGGVMIVSPAESFGNIQLSASLFNLSLGIEFTRADIASEYARNFEQVGYDWDKY